VKIELSKREGNLIRQIGQVAYDLDLKTYLVGGYVRDKLLKKGSKDIDILCIGDGIKLAHAVSERLEDSSGVTVFKRFGTAMLKSEGLEVEFVGARKESYSKDSRKPDVEPGTLDDDLNRRDFTINALAVEIRKDGLGEIVDKFGGIEDIKSEIIRTPVEPGATFSDDPLRMLRAVRFANQLNFTIDDTTFRGIRDKAHRIKIISMERVKDELQKIMACKRPSLGFKLLEYSGLLKYFLPEISLLKGVETKNGISHKDNFYHTLEVVDRLCINTDDIWLRWAALLHDVGKPKTKRFEPDHGWTFHGHELVGARMVPPIFKRLKLPMGQPLKFVKKLVLLHLRPISLTKEEATDSAVRRLLFDAGDDIDALLMLCEADITSKNPEKVKRFLKNYERVRERIVQVEERDRIRNWQPPIDGDLIMKAFDIKPSSEVGLIKEAIREAILEGDIPNEFDAAFDCMLKKGREIGLEPISNIDKLKS